MHKGRLSKRPERDVSHAELDAFLGSERAGEGTLRLAGLDGFLTCVAIGPTEVPPEEWFPLIFGEEPPQFADDQEAWDITGAMSRRLDQIYETVADETYQPLLCVTPGAPPEAEQWAKGFNLAMAIAPDEWQEAMEDADVVSLLTPMLVLASTPEDREELDLEDGPELIAEMAEMLPAMVLNINDYWGARETADEPKPAPKVGRNEPCPCGSGKKFKKCCGG